MTYSWKTGLLTVALLALAGLYSLLRFAFWEPDAIEKGTLTYHLTIPAYAKDYPIWLNTSPPLYSVNIADGPKPYVIVLDYTSALPAETIQQKAQQQGYRCERFSDASLLCVSDTGRGQTITMGFYTTDNRTPIRVSFIGEDNE